MPDPSSTCLLFSAISEGSGETAWMCRLAWSFPARICNKYLNHMKWYRQLCLTLHLRVFFLVQSVKALARLCKYAVSPQIICCLHMRQVPNCVFIPSLQCDLQRPLRYCTFAQSRQIIPSSHMGQVPNLHELALKFWPEPSTTFPHF